MGSLKKKLKIRSVTAEDKISQDTLTSLTSKRDLAAISYLCICSFVLLLYFGRHFQHTTLVRHHTTCPSQHKFQNHIEEKDLPEAQAITSSKPPAQAITDRRLPKAVSRWIWNMLFSNRLLQPASWQDQLQKHLQPMQQALVFGDSLLTI